MLLLGGGEGLGFGGCWMMFFLGGGWWFEEVWM